jgi:hypothetical protein
VDKAAVARIASMIQVNVKKSDIASDESALDNPSLKTDVDDRHQHECIPMAAASIETWGGLQMQCSDTGCSVRAVDFGYYSVAAIDHMIVSYSQCFLAASMPNARSKSKALCPPKRIYQ